MSRITFRFGATMSDRPQRPRPPRPPAQAPPRPPVKQRQPVVPQQPASPPQPNFGTAYKQERHGFFRSFGAGCMLQLLGCVIGPIAWLFVIAARDAPGAGFVAGFIIWSVFFLVGGAVARRPLCSRCLAQVKASAETCPGCGATFLN